MQAYRVLARNLRTRQRIERNNLQATPILEEAEAWRLAQALAEQQQRISGEQWQAEVETYQTRS